MIHVLCSGLSYSTEQSDGLWIWWLWGSVHGMSSLGSGETGQEITEQFQKEQDISQHTMNGIIIIYPYRFNSGFSSIFLKVM